MSHRRFHSGHRSTKGQYKGRRKVGYITRVRQDPYEVVREPDEPNGCWTVVCKIEEGCRPRNCGCHARKGKLTCVNHDHDEWVAQMAKSETWESWEDPFMQAILDILNQAEYGLETSDLEFKLRQWRKLPDELYKNLGWGEQKEKLEKALRLLGAKQVWIFK
jgi:hypothetical protein